MGTDATVTVAPLREAWVSARARARRELDAPGPCMDEQAFTVFYHRTAAPLRAYATRVLGNATHADDIVQDAYLRLLRAAPQTADSQELRRLVYRIASNLIVDHWRTQRRDRYAASEQQREPGAADPDMALRLDMEQVFARLNLRQRQLLWLAYVEGAGHREIAAVLELREGSVRVLLHRARQKLAGMLGAWSRAGRRRDVRGGEDR